MPYKLYDSIHQFEPLMPSEFKQPALLAKAHDVWRLATELVAQAVPVDLVEMLRGMNSYYTNRIEGQHTRPLEIEQALRKDFSRDPSLAAKQQLALRHMQVEREAEQRLDAHRASGNGLLGGQLYSPELLQHLHHQLFDSFEAIQSSTTNGSKPRTVIDLADNPAGVLRTREVKVGQHVAPLAASVPAFLTRWGEVYGQVRVGEASLLGCAASHQRLSWIHPFADGNGRVARLHSHCMLHAFGLTRGLWSPLRGFARSVDQYYKLLAAADQSRQGDLDGRGNLSEAALIEWMDYFLDVCLDQIKLMSGFLMLQTMRERIAACLHFESQVMRSGVRMEALGALHYLWLGGHELERGEFKAMLGLGDRTATGAVAALLQRGLLRSDTPQGRVRFGIPMHSLRFYFPMLWPEAEADVAQELELSRRVKL